jgi:DNA primase
VQPEAGRWWCRQCSPDSRWHDAIAYLRRRDGIGYREALARLGLRKEMPAMRSKTVTRTPPAPVDRVPADEWRRMAGRFVATTEKALWTSIGKPARAYLASRGIAETTARAWRLGYQPLPARTVQRPDGSETTIPKGLVIPWFAEGTLHHVKLRRLGRSTGGRYASLPGGHPLLYGAEAIAGRELVVLVEGELDALLLWQEAGDLVGVAALGSASAGLSATAARLLLPARRLLVAYDRDAAGEAGAARLAALSARVRVAGPPPDLPPDAEPLPKDLTDYHRAGCRLRDWIAFEAARALAQLRAA